MCGRPRRYSVLGIGPSHHDDSLLVICRRRGNYRTSHMHNECSRSALSAEQLIAD